MKKTKKKETQKPKTKITKNDVSASEKIAKDLFKLLKIDAKVNVSEDKENEAILINLESPKQAGLLIGSKGETLNALQMIIGMIFQKETGAWKRIIVNIADWREKQEERLEQLATQTAERVRESKQKQYLYNLNPGQRRIVHLTLAKDSKIETNSEGEGEERCLIVCLKKKKK